MRDHGPNKKAWRKCCCAAAPKISTLYGQADSYGDGPNGISGICRRIAQGHCAEGLFNWSDVLGRRWAFSQAFAAHTLGPFGGFWNIGRVGRVLARIEIKEMVTSRADSGAERNGVVSRISNAILDLVAVIPASAEPQSKAPQIRANELIEKAARTTAKISGLAAMAPGPLGLLTLLPDLIAMWRIQSQLVSDIASVYGKAANLSKEHMLWCLFKHSAAHAFKEVAFRAGERYFARRLSLLAVRNLAAAIGVRISQYTLGKAASRFLPLVGAAGVAGYAYYDTRQVGAAALAIFFEEPHEACNLPVRQSVHP